METGGRKIFDGAMEKSFNVCTGAPAVSKQNCLILLAKKPV
jgi:hypothetical protein